MVDSLSAVPPALPSQTPGRRYVVWAKNLIGPYWNMWNPSMTWENCKATGYPAERPPWMAVWLLIIADNVLHVLINGLAIKLL